MHFKYFDVPTSEVLQDVKYIFGDSCCQLLSGILFSCQSLILGMGVFAQRDFKQGQPILFYVGELLSANEGRKREQKYTEKDGSYLCFFNHNGDNWW